MIYSIDGNMCYGIDEMHNSSKTTQNTLCSVMDDVHEASFTRQITAEIVRIHFLLGASDFVPGVISLEDSRTFVVLIEAQCNILGCNKKKKKNRKGTIGFSS